MNNQSDIYYTDEGTGFPVIFIHGFCETQEMWSDFKLSFSNYRIISIDLPGFGKSPLPKHDFSIADIASQVLGLIESLSTNKAIVIAHSLGGYVTLEMVKNRPELFVGFSLFHSTAYADNEEKKDSRNKTIQFVEKRGVQLFATSFVPSLFYQKNRKRLATTINKVVEIAAKTPQNTLVAYTKAMRDRDDRTDVLKSFDHPILFIAGEKDTSVPVEAVAKQVLLPKRAVVNTLTDTGHMGMFEKPSETTGIVKDFLRLCTAENN